MAPKTQNTANVLHNPSVDFAGEPAPMDAPQSASAALSQQKKLRESGIETTKAAYICGVDEACQVLGLTKAAARINPLRHWFHRILTGPVGEYAVRTPVQALMGGLGGAAAGELHSGKPGKGALLGALSGGLGGLAVAGAPHLRQRLIQRLARSAR